MGKPPKSSHLFIGFSIIFTIHFGIPRFLESPKYRDSHGFPIKNGSYSCWSLASWKGGHIQVLSVSPDMPSWEKEDLIEGENDRLVALGALFTPRYMMCWLCWKAMKNHIFKRLIWSMAQVIDPTRVTISFGFKHLRWYTENMLLPTAVVERLGKNHMLGIQLRGMRKTPSRVFLAGKNSEIFAGTSPAKATVTLGRRRSLFMMWTFFQGIMLYVY